MASILLASHVALSQNVELGEDGWAFSAGIVGGLDVHDVSSSSVTSISQDPDLRPLRSRRPLAQPSEGDGRIFSPTIGYGMGFMAPRLSETWGRPRFFAHVDIDASLGDEVVAAATGARGAIAPPTDSNGQFVQRFTRNSVLGQGSANIIKLNPLQIRAGAGVAFSFDVYGRTLRLKPSVEYVRKTAEARAGVTSVIQVARLGTGGAPRIDLPLFGTQARAATVDVAVDTVLHGFGPAIEVELDAWRSGPSIVSLFAGFAGYGYIGDLKEEESGVTFNPNNTSGIPETGTFRFRYDSWSYRVSAGIRYRWQTAF